MCYGGNGLIMQNKDAQFTETMLESRQIFNGKILKVRQDQVLLPNGARTSREVVEHPGAVAVVPVDADGRILLVRQYRYPINQVILEIPAGKLDPGETPEECARRELAEETGYSAGSLKKLSAIFTTPGFSNEVIHLYLAEKLTPTDQKPDEDEFIAAELYSREEVRRMLADGTICDAKSMLGLLLAESCLE